MSRTRPFAALAAGAGLWLSPFGAAAFSIQMFTPSSISDGVAATISTLPSTGSLPYAGQGVRAGNDAYTAYDLSTSVFLISFDLDAQSNLEASTYGGASSEATLTFGVSNDVPYSVTGNFVYGTVTPGEDRGELDEQLTDITPGIPASVVFFKRISSSDPTLVIQGNPVGTLYGGHEYQLTYTASVGTSLGGMGSLSGTGNVALYFAPEPDSELLLSGGLVLFAVAVRRRR